MKYNHPNQVCSPREYAKRITPIYDGGEEGCTIAILEECNGNHNIGMVYPARYLLEVCTHE